MQHSDEEENSGIFRIRIIEIGRAVAWPWSSARFFRDYSDSDTIISCALRLEERTAFRAAAMERKPGPGESWTVVFTGNRLFRRMILRFATSVPNKAPKPTPGAGGNSVVFPARKTQ